MTADFTGKHVVVTGGTGALGRAVVDALLAAGAVCHVPHRGAAPTDLRASERLRLTGGVELADEAQVDAFYRVLPTIWASIHVAGGFAGGETASTTLHELRTQVDQNLVSAFLCSRDAIRKMDSLAGGRVVNVASQAAIDISGGKTAYTIAKAGVIALTRSLADEVRDVRVLVNAVVPSTIDTPANREAMSPRPEQLARWSKPGDVAATILWLASPANRVTTGALVPV